MKVYLKLTENCNLNCKHCYVNKNATDKLDVQQAIHFLKKYTTSHFIDEENIEISFHGGEVLLAPLDDIIEVCKAFPTSRKNATSNLTIPLTSKHLDVIKTYFFDETNTPFIKTSYDYDIRFNTEEQFSIWKNNLYLLKDANIKVHLIICLTTKLFEHYTPKSLLQFIESLPVDSVTLERLTYNTTKDKSLIPSFKEIDTFLCEIYDLPRKVTIYNFEEMEKACNGVHIDCRNRNCMRTVLTINANGTIGGCPNTSQTNTFGDIYNGIDHDKRQLLIAREQVRKQSCYMCKLFSVCNGDCHQLGTRQDTCVAPRKLFEKMLNNETI